ncbi:MAG: hypothetical protein ACNA7J_01305 [Wenzhouxiangella sp.]
MLPIVKRKALEIPHGLAAVAAAVCLGLAFVSDFQAREHSLKAELHSTAPTEIMAGGAEDRHSDRGANSDSSRSPARERREAGSRSSLLLWLPGFRNGG